MITKTVCFFGIYDPGYSRNRVLMKGFRENGWRVVECRADPRRFTGLSKYRELIRQYRRLRHEHFDLVIVAFPGHTVMPLARLLFGRVTFDAFLSLYDSNVFDRKVHFEHSINALLDTFWDRVSSTLARNILLDTDADIAYFEKTFGTPRTKCIRVFVGTDLEPGAPVGEDPLLVHFHGTFIPLHGIDTILGAAALLSDVPVRFQIIGRGQEYARMREYAEHLGLKNVTFTEPVPPEELAREIAPAALCLGIFGTTDKAARVIPNKVYEYLALAKPVLTADTPAIHELEALGALPLALVAPGDPAALALAIRSLCSDAERRQELGRAARAFHEAYLTPQAVVARLLKEPRLMVES